ncbi:LOW QUALITY PROTEIN: ras-GEF domain-containing family member 1A [Pseudophryne corroboree]|uniref:LOW QUALITY PROTEIN: ras-GEF domain-containing family member 1A n=1 Tax=Pseudophryne corroboree TaxID=495146 RepID=UPI0030819A30
MVPKMRESMPQTPIFPSMLGSACSGQVQPEMGEQCGDPVYQDGCLVSGSLETLIERLVPTVDYYPDRTYIFTFLLSSRVFIHPHEILAKVGQICIKQLEAGTEADKAKLKSFAAKIIQLLREWTETFPFDFQDERARKELKEIAQRITQCDEVRSTSMLVATEICRVVKKKQRTRVMEFFIDVARECFNIGNFNSTMAIISGMNLSPVARLKKTWSKVKTAKFDVLEHHMDPSSNFCNYRTALQGATQRSQSANSSREKIVIPVFNLFIKDIFFLHKIHSNRLPNGHINFKKFLEISRQIHDFLTWKQVECPFEKDKKIQTYLLTSPIYTEEALFVASFENEGPDNHMEKDSWKTLRSTLLNRA